MYQDSMGRPITVGSKVRFRGQYYHIAGFHPSEGRFGCAAITFVEEEVHIKERPDEVSVDAA